MIMKVVYDIGTKNLKSKKLFNCNKFGSVLTTCEPFVSVPGGFYEEVSLAVDVVDVTVFYLVEVHPPDLWYDVQLFVFLIFVLKQKTHGQKIVIDSKRDESTVATRGPVKNVHHLLVQNIFKIFVPMDEDLAHSDYRMFPK